MKRRIYALFLMLLLLSGLMSACGNTHGWMQMNGYPKGTYSFPYKDAEEYTQEPLTDDELWQLLPAGKPDWMAFTGVAKYDLDGRLIEVSLDTPMTDRDVRLEITLGNQALHEIKTSQYSGYKTSRYEAVDYTILRDQSDENLRCEAIAEINGTPVYVTASVQLKYADATQTQDAFMEILEVLAESKNGGLDLAVLTPPAEPTWYYYDYTAQEAMTDEEFGMYFPRGYEKWCSVDTVRRTKHAESNTMYGSFCTADGSIDWDAEELDLQMIDILIEEGEKVLLPEEITPEGIQSLTSCLSDGSETPVAYFYVQYETVLVRIDARGIPAEDIYLLLSSIEN